MTCFKRHVAFFSSDLPDKEGACEEQPPTISRTWHGCQSGHEHEHEHAARTTLACAAVCTTAFSKASKRGWIQ